MLRTLAVAATLGLSIVFATSAFAFECPKHMKIIDAQLAAGKVPADKEAQVKQLRAEGERQHKQGKHADSVKTLKAAEALLAS
jgi:hypothetical protein